MLEEPRFFQENYAYLNEKEEWCIKEDAPEWAKIEFKEYFEKIKEIPDDDDIVTQY